MTDRGDTGGVVPASVLDAFGLSGPGHRMTGGAGLCVRAGDVVLKPAEDTEETWWTADLLSGIVEGGFRLARPLRAAGGHWVVDGWSASRFVAGECAPAGRWEEAFVAARAFHESLRSVQRPAFLDRRIHRWALADRVAWGEATVVSRPHVGALMNWLELMRRPVRADCQLVHGDLSGNVLHVDGQPPAVIDFSPYWRPAEYAAAIIAVDGLLWYDAPQDILTMAALTPAFPQLAVRALIFRLVAFNERPAAHETEDPHDELASFASVISEVERLQR